MSEKNKNNEYNAKSDFVNLAIIISIITIALVGLYFYDKQSGILKVVTEQAMGMF